MREEGDEGVEDEDGYLTGESDPFIMDTSEGATVVCPAEERYERVDLPPRDDSVESTDVFKEDRLEMVFTDEVLGAPESVATTDARGVLKGRLEVYMFKFVLGDAGVTGTVELSGLVTAASE